MQMVGGNIVGEVYRSGTVRVSKSTVSGGWGDCGERVSYTADE